MAAALAWWLTLEVLGLAAWPVAWLALRPLPDRGWAVSKVLGLLLVSYGAWLIGMLQLVPFSLASNALVLVVLVLGAIWLLWRGSGALWAEMRMGAREQRRYLLFAEILFGLAFAAWCVLRAYSPNIFGTEKFMDFAFLNSFTGGQVLPPNDPWLAGHSINYYYFGYALMGTLCHLSGVDSASGFNLANVTLFSLTVLGSFGLVYNLVSGLRAGERRRVRVGTAHGTVPVRSPVHGRVVSGDALAAGVLAALLVAVAGNLAGAWQVINGHETADTFNWWGPSRVIRDVGAPANGETINEFPFFSFLLNDMHPHMLALPLVLLVLALALALLKAGAPASGPADRPATGIARMVPLIITALASGALLAANTWDYPTYVVILLLALGLSAIGRRQSSDSPAQAPGWRGWFAALLGPWWARAAAILALGVMFYLPFLLTFTSPAGGGAVVLPEAVAGIPVLGGLAQRLSGLVGVNIWPKTWTGFVTIFGVFLYALVALVGVLLVREVQDVRATGRLGRLLLLGGFVALCLAGAVAFSFPLLALLPPLAAASGYLIWARVPVARARSEELFVLLLIAVGAVITFGTEVFFLQDVFHSRLNTLFKFYYQVWVLWGLAGASAAWWLVTWAAGRVAGGGRPAGAPGRALGGAWGAGFVGLVGLAMIYPALAPAVRENGVVWMPGVQVSNPEAHRLRGLDGMQYLGETAPGDLAAIRWLRTNVHGGAGVAEAAFNYEYNMQGLHGRVSAFTGLPTIIAWPGHEAQWRGGQPAIAAEFGPRQEDQDTLYGTMDPAQARAILQRYGIRYVFVGTIEQGTQGRSDPGPWKYSPAALDKFAGFMQPVFEADGTTVYRLP
ncbi:MAG TPA: DUF2298 domain-containing protein [Chloroflexia bacterium]|nr:DUF2298 domain-containing protein [Chloroflexia bacterium]